MDSYRKFLRILSYILLFLLVLIITVYKTGLINKAMFVTIITAKLLNTLNFLSGSYLNLKGLRSNQSYFLIYVLGGMVARLFITLFLVIISYKILNLNFYSFILIFFISYIFFLVLEIVLLLKFEVHKI